MELRQCQEQKEQLEFFYICCYSVQSLVVCLQVELKASDLDDLEYDYVLKEVIDLD